MIYKTGDIVQAFLNKEIDWLVHGVNCQGVMGSGLALQIKQKIPTSFDQYLKFVRAHKHSRLLGRTLLDSNNVVHMFTQEFYGRDKRHVNYGAVANCFRDLHHTICAYDTDRKIGIPLIGAGLGGGDWDIIREIIEYYVGDYENLFVYGL